MSCIWNSTVICFSHHYSILHSVGGGEETETLVDWLQIPLLNHWLSSLHMCMYRCRYIRLYVNGWTFTGIYIFHIKDTVLIRPRLLKHTFSEMWFCSLQIQLWKRKLRNSLFVLECCAGVTLSSFTTENKWQILKEPMRTNVRKEHLQK